MATAALTAGVIRSRDEDQQLGSTVGAVCTAYATPPFLTLFHPPQTEPRLRTAGRWLPTRANLESREETLTGPPTRLRRVPRSWMIGGDDRDDAGLELDGWSYPRLEGQGTRQKMLSQTPRRWDQVATHEMRKSARGCAADKSAHCSDPRRHRGSVWSLLVTAGPSTSRHPGSRPSCGSVTPAPCPRPAS